MNKGLKVLKDIKSEPFSWEKLKDSLDTIEKDLKDYEQLQEDYEILKESYNTQSFNKAIVDNLRTLNDKLQKVLGIIKSKYVDLWLLSHFKSWNAYKCSPVNCSKTPLTREEYETIQRWFYDR